MNWPNTKSSNERIYWCIIKSSISNMDLCILFAFSSNKILFEPRKKTNFMSLVIFFFVFVFLFPYSCRLVLFDLHSSACICHCVLCVPGSMCATDWPNGNSSENYQVSLATAYTTKMRNHCTQWNKQATLIMWIDMKFLFQWNTPFAVFFLERKKMEEIVSSRKESQTGETERERERKRWCTKMYVRMYLLRMFCMCLLWFMSMSLSCGC